MPNAKARKESEATAPGSRSPQMGRFFGGSSRVAPENTAPPPPPRPSVSLLSCCSVKSAVRVVDDNSTERKKAAASTSRGVEGPELTVLLIGCNGAGKTTLAAALTGKSLNEVPDPTVGFNRSEGAREGHQLRIFDVGGGPTIRGIWSEYYADAHAAVFVVDSTASDRFAEAAELLRAATAHASLAGKPLLVLAHKQDLPNAAGVADVGAALKANDDIDAGGSSCSVRGGTLTAVSGGGGPTIAPGSELDEGLGWLLGRVRDEYEVLQARVDRDVAEQKEAERRKKEERKERLAAKRAAREAAEAKEAKDKVEAEAATVAAVSAPPADESKEYAANPAPLADGTEAVEVEAP
jgi:ADP-ribosylation factor-like protein 13B